MKVGIIGAGEIGSTLTRRLTALGIKFRWQTHEALSRLSTWPQKPVQSRYRLPTRLGAEKWWS
jgi:predicted dinucleotide-binding enzyme